MDEAFVFHLNTTSPATLTLIGALDADSAPAVAEAVHRDMSGIPEVIVDARQVTFVAAAGLTLLLEITETSTIRVAMSPTLEALVQLCGLTDRLRSI